jgi:Flp pilus assembly protein TadG
MRSFSTLPKGLSVTRPRHRSGWLGRDDGSMTVLSMFVFVAMLLVAGIAVDMMRFEHERVRLQGATDRSVISATMLRENVSGATPEQIVTSFMQAEGVAQYMVGGVQEIPLPGGREVRVTPGARIPSTFMRMVGINDLTLATPARAIEALARIDFEIVMVLDVSGSMQDFDRMQNLRNAAIDFAETMLNNHEPGQVGLTIVPYSTEVILPPAILNTLVNSREPNNIQLTGAPSFCIDFDDWANVRASPRGLARGLWRRRWCDLRSNTSFTMPTVQPYLTNVEDVRTYVNSMGPVWGTSIDLGVQTGALFFDDSIRDGIQTMIDNNQVNDIFEGRPFGWDRPNVLRSMVLLTDGENCCFHVGHAATRHPSLEIQNQYTANACAGLRDNGVTIYTIAFEAPEGGAQMMRECASSENHYFSASSSQLIDVFRGISTHIQTQRLRLLH